MDEATTLFPHSTRGNFVGKVNGSPIVVPVSSVSASTSSSSLAWLPDESVMLSERRHQAQLSDSLSLTKHDNEEVEQNPDDSKDDNETVQVDDGRQSSHRIGRWSLDEKVLFLYGLRKFGKGRWKKMSVYLPNRYVFLAQSFCLEAALLLIVRVVLPRSLVQIKSHGQKVLKRLSEGENVFRRLEENSARLYGLLAKMGESMDYQVISNMLEQSDLESWKTNSRRKRKADEMGQVTSEVSGREQIIAASALCALAGPPTGISTQPKPTKASSGTMAEIELSKYDSSPSNALSESPSTAVRSYSLSGNIQKRAFV